MFRLAEDALTGFSTYPISAVGSVGSLLSIGGLFGVIGFMITNRPLFIQMSYNTLLTGIVLIALSVIGQYTGRTYQQVQGRPLYILKKILRG
jgi:dolichol-phosphate mannosyltransferase